MTCENCVYWDKDIPKGRKKIIDMKKEYGIPLESLEYVELMSPSSDCKRYPKKETKYPSDCCGEFKGVTA